ncbi:glycosyl hydrolase 2 galactose-binding domain-containing protein [Asticcacaulis solisilvae]|uniref:glycosyl hydrolase 2 galactose-binding domain-containing protein n=1 Tax=Asticcacaulis solisilvae TaxID=1217274 RepID=UPI003FD6D808
MDKHWLLAAAFAITGVLLAGGARAQSPNDLTPMSPLFPPMARPVDIGPYNAEFLPGGDGLAYRVPGYGATDTVTIGQTWTLQAWIKPVRLPSGAAVVAAIGRLDTPERRALVLDGQRAGVRVGDQTLMADGASIPLNRWTLIAATNDRTGLRLFVNGQEAARRPPADAGTADATVSLAPREAGHAVFAGKLADVRLLAHAVNPDDIGDLAAHAPDDELTRFDSGSPPWPVSIRTQGGLYQPQPAWTLPKGKAPFSKPVAKPADTVPALVAGADGQFRINGWRLMPAPDVAQDGAALSMPGADDSKWYVATVPGTVLTTLVDRGVYPDPAIGLNNMAIPEKLARQDYWYRAEFIAPVSVTGRHSALRFDGVNYTAEIWLNGKRLGAMKGAFVRGQFDVTDALLPGQINVVAVRVSPPPHPGIPDEQSLTSGRGPNGGIQTLDGPTFVATEGWDWIPGIRDRNTGLWRPVALETTGDVRIGDSRFSTTLPGADTRLADVAIDVPLKNLSGKALTTSVTVAFDDVAVTKPVELAPGAEGVVHFDPSAFPQLAIRNPRLWWPNGYGAPNLHTAIITAGEGGQVSDRKAVRFGMRQVTYQISLLDKAGELERVEVDPTRAYALGQSIVDESHEHIRKVPGGWAASFKPGAETSAAVTRVAGDQGLAPHLLIKVNGVRIAVRGGNIGMDDMMKRVDRARLEPVFRLHRDAHLNIVRNWVGQSTEDTFYDLADEYGLMVLNDFWESTTNSNIEAEDVPLFLANATDTVRRFRNHPSVVVWFGRNEGVPQPVLNTALQDMIEREDGTRLYMGSSNEVNLAPSGPYNWREPATYFTDFARGFAVEIGTPSFPTLEAWKRAVPAEDLWPINDTWAYHDWHQDRNGSVRTFMEAMETRFGPPTGLEDFERKAQMLEYESYRAIFEGFNAGLWTTNTARMLWMTAPAWPSSHWQMFSSDYDTHGAYYGVQKASEPVHVQMNLPDYKVIAVNNGLPAIQANVTARVMTLKGRVIETRTARLAVAGGGQAAAYTLALDADMQSGPVLVQLEARDAAGKMLSTNTYWQARTPADLKALDDLPKATITTQARVRTDGQDRVVALTLRNPGKTPALAVKLGVFAPDGEQVLPAYFSDNYISLMQGEVRTVEIRYPTVRKASEIRVRGWNVLPSLQQLRDLN